MEDENIKEDPDSSKSSVLALALLPAYGGMALAVLFYVVYFAVHLKSGLSGSPSAWADFGAFFGGVTSPLVAFGAFLLLARSVMIQQHEMEKTSKALLEASKSQAEQVRLQDRAAKLNALTTHIDVVNARLGRSHDEIRSLDEKIHGALDDIQWYRGVQYDNSELIELQKPILTNVNKQGDELKALLEELEEFKKVRLEN